MPKILWVSPYNVHDISSGASIHCKTVLEGLVRRGYEVWSCASFIFDVPDGARLFTNLKEKLANPDIKVFEMDDNGIHYVYTRSSTTYENEETLDDQELLFNVYLEVLDRFAPDFVIGFGTGMVNMNCFAEAKRRGIYTIYPVLNGNHGNYAFPHTDLIVTDSKASERLYRKRDRIRMIPTGEIFDPDMCVATKRSPKYVTFINPSFEKGIAFFAKLALWAKKEFPEQRFLVVNSRGNFAENVQYLHTKDNPDEHPFKPSDFDNVDMTPATNNIRPIYSVTKVLVAPSLWWESWGRVATEAVLNDIPVLASNSGGLPEASGGAGIHLSVPDHCANDYLSIPDEEEMKPWYDALRQLLTQDWSEKLEKAKVELSIEKGIDRFEEVIRPYIERRDRDHMLFNHSQVDLY